MMLTQRCHVQPLRTRPIYLINLKFHSRTRTVIAPSDTLFPCFIISTDDDTPFRSMQILPPNICLSERNYITAIFNPQYAPALNIKCNLHITLLRVSNLRRTLNDFNHLPVFSAVTQKTKAEIENYEIRLYQPSFNHLF